MSDNSNTIHLNELVYAYACNPRILAAVDDLAFLEKKNHSRIFPNHDFQDYVDAWLAAQQTIAEYTKAVSEMWHKTWGKALINEGFVYNNDFDTFKIIKPLSLSDIWEYGNYGKIFETKFGPALFKFIFDVDNLYLEIEFENSQDLLFGQSNCSKWDRKGNKFECRYFPFFKDNHIINLDDLEKIAESAVCELKC